MTGHGDTGRLDLPGADSSTSDRLETKFAEIQGRPSTGSAPHSTGLTLAVFYFLRAEHAMFSCSTAGSMPGLTNSANPFSIRDRTNIGRRK
jgi:hypothetical protein